MIHSLFQSNTLTDQQPLHLRMLELETRIVPSWCEVTAPTPSAGTPGDTAAVHIGSLTLKNEYVQSNGNARVWADSAEEAIAEALQGTITVSFDDTNYDQVFGSSNIGEDYGSGGSGGSGGGAFEIEVASNSATIRFEDMANFPNHTADYDYNDRTFGGFSVMPDSSSSGGSGGSGGSIGDMVWEDTNENGVQDPGEYGVYGVSVELLNEYDSLLSYTQTDSSGQYNFSGQAPGIYKVRFDLPSGRDFTTAGVQSISLGIDETTTTLTQG